MTQRAALQCRVSTATTRSGDSRRERSVDEQETEGRRVCADHGWPIVAVYPEPPGSASRFARKRREMWDALLADLEAGRWEVLVVWEVSRASRELEQWAGALNTCRRRGVLIHVITHGRTYDVRVRRDWRTLADEGVDSADEPERTSERVRRAMAANIANGRPHGKIPYGYRREYDPATGELLRQVVNESEAEVIRAAAAAVLAGKPLLTIARELAAAGVPTPTGAEWSRETLRRILRNPLYVAKRRHHGQVVAAGDWPPVLDEATWYAVVAVLDERATSQRHDAAPVRWLLSGIACCGCCGTPLRVVRGARPEYRFYRCPSCHRVSRRTGWLEEYVTEVVLVMLESERLAEHLAATPGDELRRALDEVAVLEAQRAELATEVLARRMTAALAGSVEAGLAPRIEAAQARVAGLSAGSPLRGVAGPHARRTWEHDLSLEQQRAVIRALVTVRVHPAGKGSHRDPSRVEITTITGAAD